MCCKEVSVGGKIQPVPKFEFKAIPFILDDEKKFCEQLKEFFDYRGYNRKNY